MGKATQRSDAGHTSIDTIELPLMIKTLVIDGKRMNALFFKQLALEGIIDEANGNVRGTPLGWFNIHQKDCPSEAHLHVLWTRGSAPRLATVVSQISSVPTYLERQKESLRRRQDLLDLLAYCLAPNHRSREVYDQGFHYTSIGKYKLRLSQKTRALLSALEEARKQYDEDLSTWQQGAERPSSPDSEPFLRRARELQTNLTEQGVTLAHPHLYKHKPHGELEIYEVYDSEEWDILEPANRKRLALLAATSPSTPKKTRTKQDGWFIYSVPDQHAGADARKLFWGSQGTCSDEQAAEIEAQFAPQVALLRVLLAQQAIQIDLQNITQSAAVELALELQLIPEKQGKARQREAIATLKPAALYDLYQQEEEQFAAYAQRWQRHVDSFQELDQLFLVS